MRLTRVAAEAGPYQGRTTKCESKDSPLQLARTRIHYCVLVKAEGNFYGYAGGRGLVVFGGGAELPVEDGFYGLVVAAVGCAGENYCGSRGAFVVDLDSEDYCGLQLVFAGGVTVTRRGAPEALGRRRAGCLAIILGIGAEGLGDRQTWPGFGLVQGFGAVGGKGDVGAGAGQVFGFGDVG